VGPELAAFLGALQPESAVPLVAAFPKMGRTTVSGNHFVNGVPLHRTDFGKDPRHPARTNRVEKILNLSTGLKRRVWVPNVTDAKSLAAAAGRALEGRMAAGSAGFAAAIAKRLGSPAGGTVGEPDLPTVRGSGSVAVVVGSAHPLSARQADRLENGNFSRGSVVSLIRGPARRGSPSKILAGLLAQAAALEKTKPLRRWVATGGETAFALARRWKASRWRVVDAVEAGIPLCRSLGPNPRFLVLKPGGFGTMSALVKAVGRLTEKERTIGRNA
jgi:uncharacterized protein YgbK (DUF1537 family)